jgi:hypothetical protein
MGFCYEGKKLCCDTCSNAGARKKKCPYGYCQAIAQCPTCLKDPVQKAKLKAYHVHCKASHERYVRTQQEKVGLILSGYFVRCSALGAGDKGVHVLFESMTSDGSPITMGVYMAETVYQAFRLGDNVIYQDYVAEAKRQGEPLRPAPSDFSGKTTKQVSAKEFMAAIGLDLAVEA